MGLLRFGFALVLAAWLLGYSPAQAQRGNEGMGVLNPTTRGIPKPVPQTPPHSVPVPPPGPVPPVAPSSGQSTSGTGAPASGTTPK